VTFKKGKSGNPKGRPKGIKDRRVVHREFLESHAKDLMQKAVDLALEGDGTALRLCLERVVPAIKSRDEPVDIGGLEGSLTEQATQIMAAMASGELSPEEARSMLQALSSVARVTELDELDQRIKVLEARAG